tara:strand:+ start:3328 stop:3753 length:426 start_codon:yes stop_codon:yes gene_type:complete
MGYKMKGSPAKMGGIAGTASHKAQQSAVKDKKEVYDFMTKEEANVANSHNRNHAMGQDHESPAKHIALSHKNADHKRSDHKTMRLHADQRKRNKLKSEGKTVEDSRAMRRVQNRINRKMDSKVRHKKGFLGLGKYKRKVKK